MWIVRKTRASSEARRCTPSIRKRGQPGAEKRATSTTPRATTSVSRSSDTTPVARVRYQYAVDEEPIAAAGIGSAASRHRHHGRLHRLLDRRLRLLDRRLRLLLDRRLRLLDRGGRWAAL